MAQWYYFSETGVKIGPMSDSAFKILIQNGTIKRTTIIANQYGRTVQAGNIPGLPFPSVQPDSPQSGGMPGDPFDNLNPGGGYRNQSAVGGEDPRYSTSQAVPTQTAAPDSDGEESSSKRGLLIAATVFLIGAVAAGVSIYVYDHSIDSVASAPPISELRAERDELQITLEDTEFWLQEFDEYTRQKNDPHALKKPPTRRSRLWGVDYDIEEKNTQMKKQRDALRERLAELNEQIKNIER